MKHYIQSGKQQLVLAMFSTLVCCCVACSRPAEIGGKLWFYTHSTGTSDLSDTLSPANFLNLAKDGTYTSDLGQFDYGKWVYKDGQLLLISHQLSKSALPVNYLTAKEMQMGPNKGPFNNFESQPVSFASPAQDPFSGENNRWRIPAAEKENPGKIKTRLLNHFKFWEMYFTWALNDQVQYIDVRSTPTPIKIYGNGFGLKPFEQLPTQWKKYFFDEDDCRAANAKIKYIFDNNLIAWPHTDNKYKMFISAFQQMQQHLQ